MRKMKFRTRLRLLIILTLLLLSLTSFAVGKYFQTASVSGSVTFSTNLADSIVLRESKLIPKDEGGYTLSSSDYVESGTQNYILIPGLDVPKDPHIIVSGKTSVAAYLFVEVASSVDPGTLIYSVNAYSSENAGGVWKDLNLTGKNGGKVFVYTGGGENPLKLTTDLPNPVYILKEDVNGNTITVSQHLLHQSTDDGSDLLAFYASMGDVALSDSTNSVSDEIDVYKAIHGLS